MTDQTTIETVEKLLGGWSTDGHTALITKTSADDEIRVSVDLRGNVTWKVSAGVAGEGSFQWTREGQQVVYRWGDGAHFNRFEVIGPAPSDVIPWWERS